MVRHQVTHYPRCATKDEWNEQEDCDQPTKDVPRMMVELAADRPHRRVGEGCDYSQKSGARDERLNDEMEVGSELAPSTPLRREIDQ